MHSSIATTSPSPGYARTKQLARTANMAERISSNALTHRALALDVRINYNAVNTIINTCISRIIMVQGHRPFVLSIIVHALKVHCFSTARLVKGKVCIRFLAIGGYTIRCYSNILPRENILSNTARV